ncbi:MAG TPA: tetratricopeptide repeat protein [Cyclobacteriaceae bacterium]|nr:tetratricopeptide repeat protein [Cyclobacteriaceae bacterium]HRJ82956.1 tetratricopeptide repeat protein [Cyclobacteriaceae bacterium]
MFKRISILLLILSACSTPDQKSEPVPVLTGLDGKQYFEPERSETAQAKLDSNLNVAKKNFEADPSEDNYVWLGRREGYLYHYNEAITILSEGLEKYPNSYKLFRHRGHRYISIREFNKAIADLQMAASLMPRQPLEIEPDGQPNKINKPLSNVQFNVWYHLGLAHYLKGDFESAEKAYLQCLDVSDNDDLITATADWLYMTYRRMEKPEEAGKVLELIREDMNIIENDSYYLRHQMYKGMLPPDDLLKVSSSNEDVDLALATQGYGVGNWYLCEGDTTRAVEIFKQVTAGKHFAAFGFIAAEADLHRLIQAKK